MFEKLILAASIGNCVHVGGLVHFLNLAEDEGYKSLFLGPAVKIDALMKEVRKNKPYMVAVGYRLTPENVVPLIDQLKEEAKNLSFKPLWVFGGTRPVADMARAQNFFDIVFDSTEDLDDTISFLRNADKETKEEVYPDNLIDRINQKHPYPLLRHHFGLPSYEDTKAGITEIAQSKVLDVISIGPDQNTQEFFFRPEARNPKMDGAGGVPIKSEEEFKKLKEASLTGNFPLLRCYSGTSDVFDMAELLKDTLDNAWSAIPLCWYNELDGRGTRPLEVSFKEAQELIKWHADHNIPVEINEPHHWSLRDAHDVMTVTMAYVSAYNAKAMGVKNFIAQFMFNVPNSLSFSMDLAKALAQRELMEELIDENFNIYRQVRSGLPFLSADLDVAKGQLAASTYLQMALNPHIIHVVGYSEAEYAATPEVVKESCKVVRGVIRSVLNDKINMAADPAVIERKEELKREARYLIHFITSKYSDSKDPLTDSEVISDCVRRGIIDAPHIVKNDKYRGILETRVIDGKCVAFDSKEKKIITEEERLSLLDKNGNFDTAYWKSGVIV